MTKDTKSTVPVKKKKEERKKSYKMKKRKKRKRKKWVPIPGIEPGTVGIVLAHELFINMYRQPYKRIIIRDVCPFHVF